MSTFLKMWGEWIFRAVLLLLVCGQYYLAVHFVTRVEYDRDRVEWKTTVKNLNDAIARFETILAVQAVNNEQHLKFEKRLDDHELRMRLLEKK